MKGVHNLHLIVKNHALKTRGNFLFFFAAWIFVTNEATKPQRRESRVGAEKISNDIFKKWCTGKDKSPLYESETGRKPLEEEGKKICSSSFCTWRTIKWNNAFNETPVPTFLACELR